MTAVDEILFISDCHLCDDESEKSRLLVDFLEQRAVSARELYILGDLFEAWLGDDDPASEYQQTLSAIDKLAVHCKLFFIPGNRDFLIGETFAARHGITLLQEPFDLTLDGEKVLLLHGDTLCSDDTDYQAFRTQVRSPDWQRTFLSKPLSERRSIASSLRDDSKAAMQEKSSQIMDVNEQSVLDCFSQYEASVVIHGHTHRPAKHGYPDGKTRYVLGDWSPGPSYLRWTAGNGFQLFDFRL